VCTSKKNYKSYTSHAIKIVFCYVRIVALKIKGKTYAYYNVCNKDERNGLNFFMKATLRWY